MPYVERVTKAGNTIEIERYFTSRYKKKGISRGDKVKPTKEEQEKVNTRQAERKLRILINANYGYGDYHLVLDYIRRKGEPDRTPEQMRQDIDVFLRECRKEYRKAGLEFKYIHVMEIGKKGARHHHLVVNKIDTEILQRCWYKAYEGHNRVKVFPLDDSGNYAELASYLIKYTGTHKKGTDGALQGKRWNCSKNLVRPEPEYHIISDREYFKKEPKAIKGYYVDKNSVSMGVHSPEYYGYGYLRYTLVKITDTAEGALNRVDRVVVRWDLPQRDMYIAVLKGTPSAKPTATAVTRTTEIWELALADIYVGKGVTRIQTQNITDQRFNSAVCGIVTGTVEEIDASVLTKQFTDFFNTYSAAVLDEFSAYKQSMEKYLTEIAGVYDSYVSKTEGLFAQYESQFNERYSSFESTLDNWDKELLSAYTEFMAKIKLFQSDAENEFNTWFESIKDKLGEDIAGSLQLQIEELAAAMQEVKKQAEAGTKETKEAIAALDERLKRVESGWGIDYKHDAVLGLCYMGAAYMSQHYERTVETAVLGATYVGNSYLANTF